MSVNDNNSKVLLDGNGSQTVFEFGFKIFKVTSFLNLNILLIPVGSLNVNTIGSH